jgi:competence protein ComEA
MAEKINLNTADRDELEQVPGVGPKRAEAILKLREERGRFQKVEELDDLPGARGSITPETYKLFTV